MYSRKQIAIATFALLLCVGATSAEFPKIERGNIEQNDSRLAAPIDRSKEGELTIASINVRNWGNKQRGFRDFEAIIDFVDEADVILFQEVALGVYDADQGISDRESKQLRSVVALVRIHLGDEFDLVVSPKPSGTGRGAESSILAHRKHANGLSLVAEWKEWVDLGTRRDMAVFKLKATAVAGGTATDLLLGSVHLKYKDPIRGEEMNKVADWMVANHSKNIIVCGDFNWGFAKSGADGNKGEKRITELHESGTVFQIFKELSYLENDTEGKLRTNMGFRKTPRFYDQIFTSPSMATKMADGGKLLEDCGFIAFGVHSPYMVKVRADLEQQMNYGLDKFLDEYKAVYEFGEYLEEMVEEVKEAVKRRADDDSTYYVSDHRAVWAQFQLVD